MIEIIFNNKAKKDLEDHQKSGNKSLLKKIFDLITSIQVTPYEGIGNPEALKYELTGFWSRRINREHRIIYKVFEEEKIVEIYSLRGHYKS